jgi:hypothetical protein
MKTWRAQNHEKRPEIKNLHTKPGVGPDILKMSFIKLFKRK